MKNKLPVYILLIFILLFVSACEKDEQEGPRKFNPNKHEYHDGVAWVQIYDSHLFDSYTTYGDLICIDEDGVELFCMPDVNICQVSNFSNGIALVDGKYIIDKSAKLIHNLEKELGVTIEMFPRYKYDGFPGGPTKDTNSECYFDGFIFVTQEIEGVEMTGMLNSNLEWIVEPTAQFKDMKPEDNYLYYNGIMGYYDALTNEFIDEDEYRIRHMLRCFPESGIIFLECQGNHKFTYSLGSVQGKIYLENIDKTGFYNRDLDLLLDLSEYPSVKPLSDFKSNKCLISFENVREESYVGLINLEGKFIFINTGYLGHDSEKIKFKDCYFDWEGICYKTDNI